MQLRRLRDDESLHERLLAVAAIVELAMARLRVGKPGCDYRWSYVQHAMKEIQFKNAKATLSAPVNRAIAGEPTLISGTVARRLCFADLLLAFPGAPADIPRRRARPARALRGR